MLPRIISKTGSSNTIRIGVRIINNKFIYLIK